MKKDLFSGENPAAKELWLALVDKNLKGLATDEKLASAFEDLQLNPLYVKEDLPEIAKADDAELEEDAEELIEDYSAEQATQIISWNICEEIFLADDMYLNDAILPSLRRGCNYIHLKTNNWDKFFDEIRKIEFPATFVLDVHGDVTEENTVNTWRERVGYIGDKDRLIHSIEFDPVSYWMQKGEAENENKTFNNLAEMFFRLTAHLQDCRILKVDVSHLENKTADEQLAAALNITTKYFHELSRRDVPLEELIHLLTFRFSVGNNYFLEIAKLRAFKIHWINLVKAYLPEYDYIPNPYIHVIQNNADNEDKNSLIQQTTKAMSAILGGCDALRINCNATHTTAIQNILRYESNFDMYRSAADGSFYLETLTTQLAEAAWKKFQEA